MTEGREASRLGQFSWALFDWANQPFFTVVTTFIFAPYYANVMIGDAVHGQSAWAFTQSISGILIALMSPFLGAMADAGGRRKPYVFFFQVLLGIGCALLWWAYPNRPDLAQPIGWAVILATVGAEMSIVFNNAQLPNIVRPERMGWLSGFGWGLGYVGGLIALGIVLTAHFTLGDDPNYTLERLVGPASAVWLAVFVVPMFLFTPDQAPKRPALAAVSEGFAELRQSLRDLPNDRMLLTFLIANMIYMDGLISLFSFGGIYAASTFGWNTIQIGTFGLILAVAGTFGAWLGGKLDDAIGPRRVIITSMIVLLLALIIILMVDRDSIVFVQVAPPVPGGPLFGAAAERAYLVIGVFLGFAAGPLQAASRTLLIRLAPRDRITQYFGLFALTGKVTSFVGPLLVATITTVMVSQKAGMVVLIAFFVIGLALLMRVKD